MHVMDGDAARTEKKLHTVSSDNYDIRTRPRVVRNHYTNKIIKAHKSGLASDQDLFYQMGWLESSNAMTIAPFVTTGSGITIALCGGACTFIPKAPNSFTIPVIAGGAAIAGIGVARIRQLSRSYDKLTEYMTAVRVKEK